MREYVILTDSGADLPKEIAARYEIGVIDLVLQIGNETKLNGEVDPKEFYALLREKTPITTSAVNMERFKEFFEKYLKAGRDVIYLGFSSGLSATYIAGRNAAEELSEAYPERQLLTVDTLAASMGQGLLVTLAAMKRASGASLDEVYAFVMENRLRLCHWFTVDDLFFLKRGGRVSAATAVLGTMLAIKPFMHVDNEGRLINVAKVRGRRASIDAMFDKIVETAIAPEEQLYYICHGDCIEDAEYLSARIKEKYPLSEVVIGYTGTVIGAHSGPGTLALFFLGTAR